MSGSHVISEFLRERIFRACDARSLRFPDAPLRSVTERTVDVVTLRLTWGPYTLERFWSDQEMERKVEFVLVEMADDFADMIDKDQNADKWAATSI